MLDHAIPQFAIWLALYEDAVTMRLCELSHGCGTVKNEIPFPSLVGVTLFAPAKDQPEQIDKGKVRIFEHVTRILG